jgi:hypothetical protein
MLTRRGSLLGVGAALLAGGLYVDGSGPNLLFPNGFPDCPPRTPKACRFQVSPAEECTAVGVMPPLMDREGRFVGPMPVDPNECSGTLSCATCGAEWTWVSGANGMTYKRVKEVR